MSGKRIADLAYVWLGILLLVVFPAAVWLAVDGQGVLLLAGDAVCIVVSVLCCFELSEIVERHYMEDEKWDR